jgi:hypothetical protein
LNIRKDAWLTWAFKFARPLGFGVALCADMPHKKEPRCRGSKHSEPTKQLPGRPELQSALLIAALMLALALLARAVVLGIARLRIAVALLILLLLVGIALLLLVAALIVLGVLLITLGLATLLTGFPALVCHRDVS